MTFRSRALKTGIAEKKLVLGIGKYFDEAGSDFRWLDLTARRNPFEQPVLITSKTRPGRFDAMLHREAVQLFELFLAPILGQDNLIVPNAKTLLAQGIFDQFAQPGLLLRGGICHIVRAPRKGNYTPWYLPLQALATACQKNPVEQALNLD
jgi:hypothetical protein